MGLTTIVVLGILNFGIACHGQEAKSADGRFYLGISADGILLKTPEDADILAASADELDKAGYEIIDGFIRPATLRHKATGMVYTSTDSPENVRAIKQILSAWVIMHPAIDAKDREEKLRRLLAQLHFFPGSYWLAEGLDRILYRHGYMALEGGLLDIGTRRIISDSGEIRRIFTRIASEESPGGDGVEKGPLFGDARFRQEALAQAGRWFDGMGANTPEAAVVAAAALNPFAYKRAPIKALTQKLEEETETYKVSYVELPANDPDDKYNKKVGMHIYQPDSQTGAGAVVLIQPILAGPRSPADYFARCLVAGECLALIDLRHVFRNRGNILAVEFERENKDGVVPENPMLHQAMRKLFTGTVIDSSRVLDWLEDQNKVQPGWVGVQGTSMGGIFAALIAATDSRVTAAALALAGGDLPCIFSRSNEHSVKTMREHLMKKNGWTREEYAQAISKITMDIDPRTSAGRIQNAFLVNAPFDRVIPRKASDELSTAIQNGGKQAPKRKILDWVGHYPSVIYLPRVLQDTLDHFWQNFHRQ